MREKICASLAFPTRVASSVNMLTAHRGGVSLRDKGEEVSDVLLSPQKRFFGGKSRDGILREKLENVRHSIPPPTVL